MTSEPAPLSEAANADPLEPPIDLAPALPGGWWPLPMSDTVVEYLSQHHWEQPGRPVSWEVARLSKAVYLYRATATRWTVAAKFYAPKTGGSAGRHAERELQCIEEARAVGLSAGRLRAVQPLGVWRGVLFLEYVAGLTLVDVIAVRKKQPGMLFDSLVGVVELLARLHTGGSQLEVTPDFESGMAEALKYVDQLETRGVLKGEPGKAASLRLLIGRLAEHPVMAQFAPALTHGDGDATTTNFIFPPDGGVVAIDWERLGVADPAADLGRLMAEVSHSVGQQEGGDAETTRLMQHLMRAYQRAWSLKVGVDTLIERARFYQASSTLRIARNGWLSRVERSALVVEAMDLLDAK
ncbi:MAG: aminoglycoside phosphotransferase family protein [Anaerolineae bacterium]